MLTEAGASYARSVVFSEASSQANAAEIVAIPQPHIILPADNNGRAADLTPTWDYERHELLYGGQLVKRFKWPAVNQETILAAFDEEGWPARIDDPLSPQPDQDPKRRLHDTIKCLNRKQTNKLVHFRGDGTGEGVLWEPTE